MNKADLKKKWSKYCNTDKLADDVMTLLRTYKHTHSEHGVCVMLDTYFQQKEPLIKLFVTSNHYVGDMRICLQKEFDRQIDRDEIYRFFNNFHSALHTYDMVTRVDGDGKQMLDYLHAGRKLFDVDSLPGEDTQEQSLKKIRAFSYSQGTTKESQEKYNAFCNCTEYFSRIPYSSLQGDLNVGYGDIHIKKGTKTSRAFNKICQQFGVDKLNPETGLYIENGKFVEKTVYPYNKLFAQYADLVSDLKRKMRFFISLNPLDYLTMSFGVSWISCHNIRGGSYMGGCLSYMLDKTSMITFVVNNTDEGPIHQIPKNYRQMYHYDNGLFAQNRLYPQGNDGATNLYDKFRNIVIEEFSEILNVDGEWTANVGCEWCGKHIVSEGRHYKDYYHNNSCSVFYPTSDKNKVSVQQMVVGHSGICVLCGGELDAAGRLNHAYRSDCVM